MSKWCFCLAPAEQAEWLTLGTRVRADDAYALGPRCRSRLADHRLIVRSTLIDGAGAARSVALALLRPAIYIVSRGISSTNWGISRFFVCCRFSEEVVDRPG